VSPRARTLADLAATLRRAGFPVATGSLLVAARALATVDIARRNDVRDALRATLVRDPAGFELFERLFDVLYPSGLPLPEGSRIDLPSTERPAPGSRRLAEALPPSGARSRAARAREREPERDASGTASDREVLSRKDFEQMSAAELAAAHALIASAIPRVLLQRTRRYEPAVAGSEPDVRRMLRGARGRLELVRPLRRTRRRRPRHWVLLVDVSGSMATYARAFLHFAHALGRRVPGLETFAFATRLTRITPALRAADPDAAVQAATALVKDWDSGTRIGECLREFNFRWSRRTLSRGGSVLLLTDGLETGNVGLLESEARRLARACRELVWVNPLLRSASWEPLAAGAAVLAEHATRRVSAHAPRSLYELGRLVAGTARETGDEARGRGAARDGG
jgi:uncharacterized protein with von Willebrand factor type A (vWA) domain